MDSRSRGPATLLSNYGSCLIANCKNEGHRCLNGACETCCPKAHQYWTGHTFLHHVHMVGAGALGRAVEDVYGTVAPTEQKKVKGAERFDQKEKRWRPWDEKTKSFTDADTMPDVPVLGKMEEITEVEIPYEMRAYALKEQEVLKHPSFQTEAPSYSPWRQG